MEKRPQDEIAAVLREPCSNCESCNGELLERLKDVDKQLRDHIAAVSLESAQLLVKNSDVLGAHCFGSRPKVYL